MGCGLPRSQFPAAYPRRHALPRETVRKLGRHPAAVLRAACTVISVHRLPRSRFFPFSAVFLHFFSGVCKVLEFSREACEGTSALIFTCLHSRVVARAGMADCVQSGPAVRRSLAGQPRRRRVEQCGDRVAVSCLQMTVPRLRVPVPHLRAAAVPVRPGRVWERVKAAWSAIYSPAFSAAAPRAGRKSVSLPRGPGGHTPQFTPPSCLNPQL